MNDELMKGYVYLVHMKEPLEKTWTFIDKDELIAHIENNTGYTYFITSYCVEGWRRSEYAATAADWIMKLL